MYLSRRAQRLLDLIEWFSQTCQHIFPNQRTLAGYLKCSIRTVKRALAELRGHLVAIRRRYRRSNVYRLLGVETAQMGLDFGPSNEGEKQEVDSPGTLIIKQRVPIVGPTVVVRNTETVLQALPKAISRETLSTSSRDDAALSSEVELKTLAGLPGKRITLGDRAFLAGLDAPREVVEVGILLGRARKLAQRATTGRNEPIRSLRYFAGSIAEVQSTAGISELAVYRRSLERQIARMVS